MPLLQRASFRRQVEAPKPLGVNKPSTPVSSSSSSPSHQKSRWRSKPVSDLYNLEYPEPLRIKRSTSTTTPVPLPPIRLRPQNSTPSLPRNELSISNPLPPEPAPYQHRRLEISPLPIRPRLTPPSKEKPVDSAHQKSDAKTPRTPKVLIKRRRTYHITNEPATPALPPGPYVSVTTGGTTSSTLKSSPLLAVPTSPFRNEKDSPFRSNVNNGVDTILPAPLTPTLSQGEDILRISQSVPLPLTTRRTEIKRKLKATRRTISSLLPWNSDPKLHKDLEVMDEKLKTTAQAVTKSGEEWRDCATFLPSGSAFDGFGGPTEAALNGALEVDGSPGERIGESEPVEARDIAVQRVVETRGLTLERIRSRRRLDGTP